MRANVSLVLALSAYWGLAAGAALLQPGLLNVRANSPDGPQKPKYSIVPLEPGPNQPGGGSGSGSGGNNDNQGGGHDGGSGDDDGGAAVVTVTQTVPGMASHAGATKTSQSKVETSTSSIAIIGIDGGVTKTETVTVVEAPATRKPASRPTSTSLQPVPEPTATPRPAPPAPTSSSFSGGLPAPIDATTAASTVTSASHPMSSHPMSWNGGQGPGGGPWRTATLNSSLPASVTDWTSSPLPVFTSSMMVVGTAPLGGAPQASMTAAGVPTWNDTIPLHRFRR